MRNYPSGIDNSNWRREPKLYSDYTFRELEAKDDGVVLNPPEWDGKSHFVSVSRHGDLECLLKDLPTEALYDLSFRSFIKLDGRKIRRPRPGRDDMVSITSSGKRGTYIYGANYLVRGRLGNTSVTQAELEAFLTDQQRFVDIIPSVPIVARALMRRYLSSWGRVRAERVPPEVSELFYKYGRGGNQDISVVGTRNSVKVDQTMAYLSALCLLPSPAENVSGNKIWLDDGLYDEEDDFGIYCVDVYISETLSETPVYKNINDVVVPIRGHCKEAVILKPTMDCVKELERSGLAKVGKIHWSWRFKSTDPDERPFKGLYGKLLQFRTAAVESALFWKLVACAIWGMTLQTYTDYDASGKPIMRGGFWFNPVIGFTVTDMMRAINFRMKMRSMNIGAEVVDMLVGPDGDWYANESVKVKGPYDYTSINPRFHVAKEDDRNNLLGLLSECKQPYLKFPVKGRRNFRNFIFLKASHAKELFGVVHDHYQRVGHEAKRKEPPELRHLPMKELLNTNFRLFPFTEEEAQRSEINCDSESEFELMMTTDFLGELLSEGKTW